MPVQIQIRNGTAAQWTAANPTLAAGEVGIESDTKKQKFGDGTTAWNSLGYAGSTGTVSSVAMSVPTFLSVTGSPVTSSGTLAVSLSGTALPVANGGTGQTTATAAFDALAPSQTSNSGKYLTTNGTTTSWATVSGGGSPAGADTQVQYNSGGTSFGASSAFTFTSGTGVVTATGFSGAVNGTVGATTPAAGAFTTLAASSTVSGTGFSTYLASPPAIGGTTPAAGTFTTAKSIAAATQDAVQLQGRAGGTGSYVATITPTTLTASRTVTLPNADINFATGLPVANGGTGLTAGTSGGIPYYSGTSAITSSALLTQYGIVYGGGAGAAPVATAVGTTGQFLGANTGGAPTWQTPSGGSSGPTFAAYLSTNQNPTLSTFTKVTLNATQWDTASAFNTTSNRFLPTTAGYYLITVQANYDAATTCTDSILAIYKNGSNYARVFRNNLRGTGVPSTVNFAELISAGSAMIYFNGTTDYVELYIYIVGSGTATVYNGTAYTTMTGAFIRT